MSKPTHLIYRHVVALDRRAHADLCIEQGASFAFAAGVNAVPVIVSEMGEVTAHLTVVFAGEPAPLPAALLGLRDGENLYVSETGAWEGGYVPAFLRQYPFIVAERPGADAGHVLSVDESFEGLNRRGAGQRLFDADGRPSAFLNDRLASSQAFHGDLRRTRAVGAALAEAGLLLPMTLRVDQDGAAAHRLGGLLVVDRARLDALAPDALARLRDVGALQIAYLHLASLTRARALVARRTARVPSPRQGAA